MVAALGFALRGLRRDLKSGELAVLLAALLVAVGSLTAVGFFTDRIGRAVNQQAGEVLAADLRLESPREISDAWKAMVQPPWERLREMYHERQYSERQRSYFRKNMVNRSFRFVSTGVIQRGDSIWAVQIFFGTPRAKGIFQ